MPRNPTRKGHQDVALHTAQDVANWFLATNWLDHRDFYCEPLNKNLLHFLMVEAQGWWLAYTGKALFSGDIVAGRRGPEVAGLYEDKRRIKSVIVLEEHFYFDDFSEQENQFLKRIWDIYGCSTREMIDATNGQDRWKRLRAERGKCAQVVPHELLRSYFHPEYQPWTFYNAFSQKDAQAIWPGNGQKK